MREAGPDDIPVLLAATDPAQPYGASLPWPATGGRPARQAGAHVVLIDGIPAVYVERGGHALVTFAPTAEDPRWAEVIKDLATSGRYRNLEIRKIDGERVLESPHAATLKDAGFTDGYRGLTWRPTRVR
jgi:ATP-dependent Lhr-like helicase